MRLLVEGGGPTAKYKETRGPDGARFAKWRNGRRARIAERFGYDVDKKGVLSPMDAAARRRLRNARKLERQIARAA